MRILLADDEDHVRFALQVLLEAQPGLHVVAEAVDAAELLAQAASSRPDVVLLDWELPGLTMSATLPVLRRLSPGVRILVLSGRPEAKRVALAAGADAFISKSHPPEQLLAAFQCCEPESTREVA
jgi:two-component system response regulator DesR